MLGEAIVAALLVLGVVASLRTGKTIASGEWRIPYIASRRKNKFDFWFTVVMLGCGAGYCAINVAIHDAGALLAQSGRRGQQQQTASRNSDAFARHRPPVLRQRQQAARAHDPRQRPPRKRQKQLPCARGQDQVTESHFKRVILLLRLEPAWGR